MKKTKKPWEPRQVSAEVDGKTYSGTVVVSGKIVRVSAAGFGAKTAPIGDLPVDEVARTMIGEIVRGAKQKGIT